MAPTAGIYEQLLVTACSAKMTKEADVYQTTSGEAL